MSIHPSPCNFAILVLCLFACATVSAIEMVSIPAGTFTMGRRDDGDDGTYGLSDEIPRHQVTLSAYEIGKFEVTNGEFADMLNWANGRGYLKDPSGGAWTNGVAWPNGDVYASGQFIMGIGPIWLCNVQYSGGTFGWKTLPGTGGNYSMERHPACGVTWYGCICFCNWLSEREGRTPAYNLATWELVDADPVTTGTQFTNGYRLPTEAEWERAAAWDGTKHWIYGFASDTLTGKNRCNYQDVNPLGIMPRTSPVGWFNGTNVSPNGSVQTVDSPSPAGCYDMSGNIWEWCQDWYGTSYGSGAITDPTGAASGSCRVLRGGGTAGAGFLRSACRYGCSPDLRFNGFGFRVARSTSFGDVGQFVVAGRVRNAATQAAIAGATVGAGGKSTTTDAQGDYMLAGVGLGGGATLTVSKVGYTTASVALEPTSASVRIVCDVELRAASASRPVIADAILATEGYFLAGVPLQNTVQVAVDWGDGAPGQLLAFVDGVQKKSVVATGSACILDLDMGTDFPGKTFGQTCELRIVAVDAGGRESQAWVTQVPVIRIEPAFQSVVLDAASVRKDGTITRVNFSVEWPPEGRKGEKTVTLPFVGQLGGGMSVEVKGMYEIETGKWELAAGKSWEQKKWHIPGPKPKYARFKIAAVDVDTEFGAEASGMLRPGSGLTLDEFGLSGGLDGRWRFLEFYFTDFVPGLNEAVRGLARTGIPGVDDIWSLFRVNAYFTLDTELKAVIGWDPLQFKSLDWPVDPGIEASYEPKISDILEGRLYAAGAIGWTTEIAPDFVLKDLRGSVTGGAELRVWLLTFGPYEAVFVQSPAASGMPTRWETVWAGAADMAPKPFKRDYLKAGSPRFVAGKSGPQAASGASVARAAAQTDTTLIENVFPYSEPSLAANGNELMLLSVGDNGTSGALNFTDINWMHFDGSNWSAPVPILADTRAEFRPQVAFDGNGDAVAVWERVRDPLFDTADITAMAAQMEIVTAKWDHLAQTWTMPVPLTSNAHLNHAPLVCGPMGDGSVLAVWTENTKNLLIGSGPDGATSNSQVLWTRWNPTSDAWAAPTVLVANLPYRSSQSLAGTATTAVYAWTRDTDGMTSTTADQEVFFRKWDGTSWAAAVGLTSDTIADTGVRAAVRPSGEACLVWRRGTDLVMNRGLTPGAEETVRTDCTSMGFGDVLLTASPQGDLAVVWQEMDAAGSNPHFRVYDTGAGRWSGDQALLADRPLERSFAAAWDTSESLVLAYDRIQPSMTTRTLTLSDGHGAQMPFAEPGQADLCLTRRALVRDLAIEPGDLQADTSTWLPGQPVTFKVCLRNSGDFAVENPIVSFYNGAPGADAAVIARLTVAGYLDGASSVTLTTEAIYLNGDAGAPVIYAVADPENDVAEGDETNNEQHISFAGTDLEVALASQSVRNDGAARIVAVVRNLGAPGATTTTLAIRAEGQTGVPLATVPTPALGPGELTEVAIDLPAGTVGPVGTSKFVLKADDSGVVASEADPLNNLATIILYRPDTFAGPTTGSLQVSVAPSEVVVAGAKWRRLGTTAWFDSDYVEAGLTSGTCTVEFEPVAGWTTPANRGVAILGGQTTATSGTYVLLPIAGAIQETLAPPEAVAAGARWRILSDPTTSTQPCWRASHTSVAGVPAGNWNVAFLPVTGWIAPATRTLSVSEGETLATSATYTIRQCTVTFQTDGEPGATLTGTTPQTVNYGTDCAPVTANAPTGWRFVRWTKGGEFYSTNRTLGVTAIKEDMTLIAEFAPISPPPDGVWTLF